jgi:ParB-like nuclease domain
MDYKIHPLAELFPSLPPDEFQKLKADIQKNGQIEPISVNWDLVVLDGRHRLQVCKELGTKPLISVDPSIEEGRITEAEFIWSKNFVRRHLTDDQRAAIAVKWSKSDREAAEQRRREHGGTAPGRSKITSGESTHSVRTRTVIAEKAGVSEHKVRQAEVVAAKSPQLTERVAHGEIKLKDAVQKTVHRLHPLGSINLTGDTFNEQAALVRLYNDWEKSVEKHWQKNRNLEPVILKVRAFATYLEGLQRVRAAELRKKLAAIL